MGQLGSPKKFKLPQFRQGVCGTPNPAHEDPDYFHSPLLISNFYEVLVFSTHALRRRAGAAFPPLGPSISRYASLCRKVFSIRLLPRLLLILCTQESRRTRSSTYGVWARTKSLPRCLETQSCALTPRCCRISPACRSAFSTSRQTRRSFVWRSNLASPVDTRGRAAGAIVPTGFLGCWLSLTRF